MEVTQKIRDQLAQRWHEIEDRVSAACQRAGRPRDSVRIVGVTKYVDADVTNALVAAGCIDLGESRPQVLCRKREIVIDHRVRWHLIGHLQRNKVARTIPLVNTLHTLDSLRLAESISSVATKLAEPVDCLIEVNISNEEAKTGVPPDEVDELAQSCVALRGIRLIGLMGMASHSEDLNVAKQQFLLLRSLQIDLHDKFKNTRHPLNELSMGMSHDFEVAIECEATIVRIGSSLFDGIVV